MAKGSNDLNALLKAKVVKLKAELDVAGSMPHIRRQVDDITKRLANKPVKLKVVLDSTITELNRQLRALSTRLHNSKSFKPIKLKVDIDIAGSAILIKQRLGEVGKAIDEFNQKFSKQINMLGQLNKRLNQEQSRTQQSMNKPITTPKNAGVDNIGVKKYIQQLREAEAEMRRVFGNKGNFSSFEFKDKEGNLKGFIAQLEKADGVIQKVRYNLNQDSGKFELVDQQTITQTQKSVEKAVESLRKLKREIDNMGKGDSKNILLHEYRELEKMGKKGMLDKGDVNALNELIKREKDLAEVYKYQRKLIEDIAKAKAREKRSGVDNQYGDLMKRAQGTTNLNDLKALRVEQEKLASSTNKYNKAQTTSQQMDVTRTNMLRQLESASKRVVTQNGLLSQSEMQKTRAMINGMQSQQAYIKVQQRVASMNKQLQNQQHAEAQRKALNSLKQSVMNWGIATGKSVETVNRYYEQLKTRSGNSISAIEKQTRRLTNAMKNGTLERVLKQQQDSAVKHINGMTNKKFKALVDNRDIDALKRYVGELNKGSVATMKLVTDSKGMTRVVATMESAGKTARQLSYEISNVNNQLRRTGTSDVFNANRNLGVMEQLRIAMARVPIWMASMTAFYGTLRGVQAMMRQIVEVDKLMTDIARVAHDGLNMDSMFQGAVDLSKELGNNLQDILTSLGEYARTFGDFNERQLMAITRTATLMSNVSDLTAQEATESLVGTMNAFNITAEESIHIVDALNEVDNNYAISTKQLAEGLSKSASTAKTFGITMEESVGHITAIGSVTMESGKQIGNGLKTIYSRITTLDKSEEVLKSVGVEVRRIGENGEEYVRPVNDILTELAGKWYTLSDAQRQQIAVDVAGRYQLTRFLALMSNYGTALDATATAHTSHGSAIRENAKYMKSFEARINQLKNSFSEMALAIGDAFLSGAMLTGIELLKDLAGIAKTVADNIGVLPLVFGALFLLFGRMGIFGTIITKMTAGIKTFKADLVGATGTMARFGVAGRTSATMVSTAYTTMGVKVRATMTALRASLAGLLASTGVGIAFVALGFAIEHFVGKATEAKQKAEELATMNAQLIKSYREVGQEKGMTALIGEYDALLDAQGKLKEGTEEHRQVTEELDRKISEINEKFPTMTKYVDATGKAHLHTTKEMLKQVEATKALSEAQANVEVEAFNENIAKQTKNYAKLTKELEKLEKQRVKLEEKHGTKDSYTDYGNTVSWEVDNSDKLALNQLDQVLKQAEITEAIQGTIGMIQKASVAYQEQSGTLSHLGDSQLKVVENVIGMNEEILRSGNLSKESQSQLFEFGNAVGDVFANTHKEMSKAIENAGFDTIKEREELELLDVKLSNIADAIPKDMFNIDSADDIPKVTEKISKMVDIMKDVDEDTSFATLKQNLMDIANVTEEEAIQAMQGLAREQDQSRLKSELQAQGYEDVAEELDDLNEKMIEALDLSKELLGYGSGELSALQDRFKLMHLLVDIHGEDIKQSERYLELQREISEALGVSVEKIANNPSFYADLVTTMQKIGDSLGDFEPSQKAGKGWKDFLKNIEGLNQEHVNYLLNTEEGREVLSGLIIEQEKAVETTGKQIEANEDLKSSAEDLKVKQEELKVKFEELKNDTGSTDARNEWLDGVRADLNELGGEIQITKDDMGNFKLTMADGSTNPYLDTLQKQMNDLDYNFEIVKDEAGNLKLMLNDGTSSLTLTTLQGDLDGTNLKIDDTKINIDELDQKEVKPEVDVDFDKLMGGLGDVDEALGGLDEAFGKLEGNIEKLGGLKGVIGEITGMFDSLRDAMSSMFSNSKGDFEDLQTKAKNAKKSIDDLKGAIDKIKNLASRIDMKGIEKLEKSSKDAKKAIEKLGEELKILPLKAEGMSGGIVTASDKAKKAIEEHKKAIEKLGKEYDDVESDVKKSMESMKDKVVSTTNTMIGRHNSQSDAIDDVAQSARDARTAISNMNTSIASAMTSMDRYIAKANQAQKAGNSVPKAPSGGLGGFLGGLFGGNSVSNDAGTSEGIAGAMSTFSASAGEATGGSSSGGGGTSGTITPSVFDGGVNLDGVYEFGVFATKAKAKAKPKEEKQDLFKPNYNERSLSIFNGLLSELETKMQRIAKSTVSYRNSLKSVISYQNKILTLSQKELKVTESRQKAIEKRLKALGNTSKHTAKQREEYNNLQQEYDGNISKIASLKQNVQSITNDIKAKSEEIFSDFIDEIVGKYDTAINKLKAKTDDIDFKIDVLALTDPDNLKKQLDLLAEKSNVQQQERNTLANKTSSMESEYNKAVKKYGKNSSQAKKVKEELDAVKEAWEDATLAVLQTEKQIKDVRGQVADESIKQLKDYYKNMKDMAVNAIEAEKKALEEAHKKKMSQYDEQTKAINAVYDAQFKKMDAEKSQAEYQEGLDEKNAKKAELLNKISLLSRDTSLEGRKKLEELKKELADAEKDISDFMKSRQETLLKEELEAQKQAQLDAIEAQKEAETLIHEEKIEKLDTEKSEVEKHYDDILNDEKAWADKRAEFISGNFATLTKELEDMNKTLAKMNKGNFDMLTDSFKNFSDEVKKEMAEMNELTVDNMIFNSKGATKDAKDVGKANKPKNVKTGTKVTTPKMTTEPAKPKSTTPAKTKPKENTPAPKPADSNNRMVTASLNFRKSPAYGNNVIQVLPKSAKVQYVGMEKGWAKIKYNGKTGYVGNQYLKKFDTGGYTGDWSGNDGKVAMLHKKELVLNERQTSDILNTAKLMDKLKNVIPSVKRNNFSNALGVGAGVINNYELTLNFDKFSGDKEDANRVVKEVMKGLKKMGK